MYEKQQKTRRTIYKKRPFLGGNRRYDLGRSLNPIQPVVNISKSVDVTKKFIDDAFLRPELATIAYQFIVGMTGPDGEHFIRWDDCIIALIDTLMHTKKQHSDIPPEPLFLAALREHLQEREKNAHFICHINPRDTYDPNENDRRQAVYCHS